MHFTNEQNKNQEQRQQKQQKMDIHIMICALNVVDFFTFSILISECSFDFGIESPNNNDEHEPKNKNSSLHL